MLVGSEAQPVRSGLGLRRLRLRGLVAAAQPASDDDDRMARHSSRRLDGCLPAVRVTNTRPDLNDATVPGDLGAGIAWLYRAQDGFIATVAALSDESVFESRPAHWGELVPVARLVTTMLTEHVHHVAEIGVLRDLRRGHSLSQTPPPPIRDPSWWTGRKSTDT